MMEGSVTGRQKKMKSSFGDATMDVTLLLSTNYSSVIYCGCVSGAVLATLHPNHAHLLPKWVRARQGRVGVTLRVREAHT